MSARRKSPPERRMTVLEAMMTLLRLELRVLKMARVGVSMYLVRISKMSTFAVRMLRGTVLLYCETKDLILSKTSTMPVLTPFCRI